MSILADVWEQHKAVSFADASSELHTGDLLLASGDGVVSNLIRHATDSIFSHVGLIVKLPVSGQWLVLESVETVGVRCVTLENGYVHNYNDSGQGYSGRLLIARCAELEAGAHILTALYQRAFSLLGDHYNKEEIFEIAARIVAAKVGIHKDGRLHTGRKYICSEYVYACFKSIGITFPFDAAGFIAPSDIAQAKNVYPVLQLATSAVTVTQDKNTV